MNSRPVKRIEDVVRLRTAQFSEDSGPIAHPIRPESYIKMDNFYTVTVYEKGAEIIRVYHTLLGKDGFRYNELHCMAVAPACSTPLLQIGNSCVVSILSKLHRRRCVIAKQHDLLCAFLQPWFMDISVHHQKLALLTTCSEQIAQ